MGFTDIFRLNEIKQRNSALETEVYYLRKKLDELGCGTYDEVQQKVVEVQKQIGQRQLDLEKLNQQVARVSAEASSKQENLQLTEKQLESSSRKLRRSKELYKAIVNCIDNFTNLDLAYSNCKISVVAEDESEDLAPSVILKLHNMDVKALRKAIENVRGMTAKYLRIAGEGNQSIAGTLTKFIGEIEYLFINAVKIEYNYYVKKEQARQEQLAIREQMRQEAEERRALEAERKKIEAEESKYKNEIEKITLQIQAASDEEKVKLQARILALQAQLSDVVIQKEKIVNLANGRTGNVYVISNLGSFGENMFKVGMTRRLNPQDRVDELGDASVPFKFDVHSFIFSDDAVGLESRLHSILEPKRVNKVNRRKEFFYTNVDELEQLVQEIEPTAEFNRTMMAEEFRQSQSTDSTYTSDYVDQDDEDE